MSGGSSGGTNTVSTSSTPPSQFTDAYTQLLGQAQNAASTPYQQYTGQLVAGLSPDQESGISAVENAQGAANPYINAAAQEVGQSTQDLWGNTQQYSPSAIEQYESPYTQSVLNTTEAAENNQDAIQQQGIVGNAISAGAWGGDRSAVAQGITAGQQAIANNATNANIEQAGFTSAQNEFNTEQTSQLGANEANSWLASQGANTLAGLGNEAESTELTGANALLSTGSLEQGQAQAELNVPYEQYQAALAYPYQQDSWLQGLETNLGSSAGGTGTTSSPAANPISQYGGLALGTGALGLAGYNAGLFGGSAATAATSEGVMDATAAAGGAADGAAAGETLDTIAGLAGIARGGSIPQRGIVVPFRPRATGGGILSNDNWPEAPIPHRAYGGIAMPVLPTNSAGILGGNGVSIPQLGTGNGIVAQSSPTSVSSYLANAAAGASHAMPQTYTPPALAAASSGTGAAAAPEIGSIGNFQSQGIGDTATNVPLAAQARAAGQASFTATGANGQSYQVPTFMFDPDPGRDPGSGGQARGGGIVGFADGGAPDGPDLSQAMTDLPVGAALANWWNGSARPSQAPSPVAGLVPHGDGPDAPGATIDVVAPPQSPTSPNGEGYSDPADATAATSSPPQPGIVAAPTGGSSSRVAPTSAGIFLTGGNTDVGTGVDARRMSPSMRTVDSPQQGIVAQPVSYNAPVGADSGESTTNKLITSPWLALARAGFGMAAGTSPQAGVNIGRGAEQGIQALEEIPQERQALTSSEAAQENLDAVRQIRGQLGITGGTPGAARTMPGGGIGGGGGQGGSGQTVVSQSGAPLFNIGDAWNRAQTLIASGVPGYAESGKALMESLTTMMKEGFLPTAGGGVMPISGAGETAARQAGLIAQAKAPYEVATSLARNAGRPVVVKPGENVTSGFNTLPPELQGVVKGVLGSGGAGGSTQSSAAPDAWDTAASVINGSENPTGNPSARNPNSSATGNGQFTNDTWLSVMHKAIPGTQSMPDDQVLSLRADPDVSQTMTKIYAQQNAPVLQQAGLPVNTASLKLAHWFGPDGAVKVATAPATTPIENIIGADAARNNGLSGQTAGMVVRNVAQRFGTAPLPMPGQQGTQYAQAGNIQTDASAQGNSSFTPSPVPTGSMIQVTRPPPDLPPSQAGAASAPTLQRQPDGSMVSVQNPLPLAALDAQKKEIAEIPQKLTELNSSQALLVGLHDAVLHNANSPGWYQSGAGAEFRQDLAKGVNGALAAVGAKPLFSPTDIANNEVLSKDSTLAAFTLARSVSSRVALGEVLQSNKAVPNMGNTPFGNIVVNHMLMQLNTHQIDRSQYVYEQAQRGADPEQAGKAFDAVNPPSKYITGAMASATAEAYPQSVAALKAAPTPANRAAFDKRYGDGTAGTLLGQ
jgi:hypothetical protein